MRVNNALEQIFVRYVRARGRSGRASRSLRSLRSRAIACSRDRFRFAPAVSRAPARPGRDSAAASTLTNTAQRGVSHTLGLHANISRWPYILVSHEVL